MDGNDKHLRHAAQRGSGGAGRLPAIRRGCAPRAGNEITVKLGAIHSQSDVSIVLAQARSDKYHSTHCSSP